MAVNEYEDTLDQVAAPAGQPVAQAANPYADTLKELDGGAQAGLRKSFTDAAPVAPDRAADVRRLSLKLGVPPLVVDRNYDQYKTRDAAAQPVEQIHQETPHTSAWLQDPNNAAIAKDDLQQLGTLEWLFTAPQRAFAQGAASVQAAKLKTKLALDGTLTQEEHDLLESSSYQAQNGGQLGADGSWFRKGVTGGASFLPVMAAVVKYGVAGALETGLAGAGVGSVVPGPGTLAGAITGASYGFGAGMMYGGAKIGFQLSAGQAHEEYSKIRDEAGRPLDPNVVKAAAIATGIINAGLMSIPIENVVGAPLEKLTASMTRDAVAQALKSPSVRGALLDAVKSYGGSLASTTATMIGMRAVTILGGELAKKTGAQGPVAYRGAGDIFGDLLHEGVNAAEQFALVSAAGPVMELARARGEAVHAQAAADYFTAIGQGMTDSKAAQRSPAAVQDLIEHATKDGPIPAVYAPIESWSTYWQGKDVDPAAMAKEVTGDADAYANAVRTGTDLKIPTARYATTIAPTEHNAFFSQELRLGPDEMNAREGKAFVEAQEQAAKQAAQAELTPREQIRQQITERLGKAGVMGATADAYADLIESGVGTMAEHAGLDPAEVYSSYGLQVLRPDVQEALGEGGGDEVGGVAGETSAQAGATAAPEAGALPLEFGPNAYAGPERRAEAGAGPDGLERRSEQPIPTGSTAEGTREAAKAMRAENPQIDAQAAAMRARAAGVERPSRPRSTPANDAIVAKEEARAPREGVESARGEEVPPASEAGARPADAGTERGGPDEAGNAEGRGDGNRAERGRFPTPGPDEIFERQPAEAVAARLTPDVRREVVRILDEMETFPFVERTWEWLGPTEKKTGNAAGGDANIVAGSAGAAVYDDVLYLAPVNKNSRTGKAGKEARGSRGKVAAAAQSILEKNDVTNNLAEGVLRVAERRAAGEWKDLSRPELPHRDGVVATKAFTDNLSAAIDDAVEHGDEGDISFNTSEFGQGLFDAANQALEAGAPDEKVDTLDTGEQQARLPGAGDVREQDIKTPEFEAPFSLTPPENKGSKGKQSTLFQSAYHGSPHEFDEFSLHAIGTGEGAQAYGWGLYFASNREIAEFYRDKLTDRGRSEAEQLAADAVRLHGTKEAAAAIVEKKLETAERARELRAQLEKTIDAEPFDRPEFNRRAAELDGLAKEIGARDSSLSSIVDQLAMARDVLEQLRSDEPIRKGRVYTVDVPEDTDMLAWDKPASQQSPKVQAALKELGIEWEPFTPKTPKQMLAWLNTLKAQRLAQEDVGIREALREAYHLAVAGDSAAFQQWQAKHQGLFSTHYKGDMTGEEIYAQLQQQARAEARHLSVGESAKFASLQLNSKGVAGIQYLDGASRRRGEGSSNYVVFDDRLVKIKEYDQPFFHGSPHDFQKFSLQHVGTGEGAAAYGWGLYFAENPAVAADYHDRLSEGRDVVKMKLGSLSFGEPDFEYSRRAHVNSVENIRASLAEDILSNPLELNAAGEKGFQKHVLARLDDKIAAYEKEYPEGVEAAKQLRAELAKPGAASVEFTKTTGGVYQVDIPEEHVGKMIDWDAPLAEQTDAVKQIVREQLQAEGFLKAKDTGPRQLLSAWKAWRNERAGMGEGDSGATVYQMVVKGEERKIVAPLLEARKAIDDKYAPIESWNADKPSRFTGPTGEADFKEWVRLNGAIEKAREESAKNASLALAKAGVPGLRYFDQGSRDAGKGTRNVVVFDDSIVKLTHKDGTPLTEKERKDYFQGEQGPADRRGSISFGPDGKVAINLFAKADLSTFLHETGHFFLEVFGDLTDRLGQLDPSTLSDTQKRMLGDYGAILKELGVENRHEIGREHHEQFARQFESYLFEGKAPNLELQSAFSRFRAWLLGVYRSLANLKAPLTDEVRGVFDRMLATDQSIAAAESRGRLEPMFTTAESAGMSEQQFSLYRDTVAKASQTAREQLDAKLLGDVRREQEASYKAQRADVRGKVSEQLAGEPVYQAIAAIRKGTRPDGAPLVEGLETPPMQLSRAIVVDRYGAERAKALPRGLLTSDGGLDPDVVAEHFGFTSGDEMLQKAAGVPEFKDAIEQETNRQMVQQHGSTLLDGSVPEKAQAAAANEDRDVIVRAELRALAQLRRTVAPFEKQAKQEGAAALKQAGAERAYERRWLEAEAKLRIAIAEGHKQVEIDALEDEVQNLKQKARGGPAVIRGAVPPAAALKDVATRQIGQTRIRELQPAAFWSASRRAAQQAIEKAARQDFDGAIQAKTSELLNLNLYREAEKAKDDVAARLARMADIARPAARSALGLAGDAYLDQVDGILDRYEFSRVSDKVLARRANIRKFVEGLEAQGLPVDLPAEVLDDARRINYREISYDELVGVTDGVAQILHLARLKNKLLTAIDRRDFRDTADGIIASINASGAARPAKLEILPKDKLARNVEGWFASHTKLATFVNYLDGGKDGGPMWEAFMRPLNEAGTKQASMHEAAAEAMTKILTDAYSGRELAKIHDRQFIPEIGGSLSKEARLAVALNWGNEGNRQRLMESARHWNASQVQAILDTLDDRDLKFVQASLDYVNSFRDQIAAKEKRVTGLEPEWVEAASWNHSTYGEQKGGYYPIVYDGRLSLKQGNIVDAEAGNLQQHANYAYATTKRGYLESREARVNAPVRLELSAMYEHVEQVLHDLSHHETLIDVGRLMADRGMQQAILSRQGDIVYKQMRGALLDIALGTRNATTIFDRAMNFVRSGATIAGIGWNPIVAIHHLAGTFNGAARIGATWELRGALRVFRDAASMESSARWVNEKSETMRLRNSTMDRDVNDLRTTLARAGGWFDDILRTVTNDHVERDDITRSYSALLGGAIKLASLPTWIGQYEKALAEQPGAEARAIAMADQAVLDAHGSGQIKDLAEVQRGGALAKLFTTFYTYGNLTFNQTAREFGRTNFRQVGSVGQMLTNLSLIYLAPAAFSVAVAEAFGKNEKGDSFVGLLGREALAMAMNTMVGVRELSGAAQMAYAGTTGVQPAAGNRGYEGPTGLRLVVQMEHLVQQAHKAAKDGVADSKLVRSVEDVAGVIFHLPIAQVQRSIDGFAALQQGKTQNPAALLVGAPKEK